MTSNELFWTLLMTGLLTISGVREVHRCNFTMGATLLLIPVAGWLAILMGRSS